MKAAALKSQEAIFGSSGFCTQGGYVFSSSCQEGILKDSLDALISVICYFHWLKIKMKAESGYFLVQNAAVLPLMA